MSTKSPPFFSGPRSILLDIQDAVFVSTILIFIDNFQIRKSDNWVSSYGHSKLMLSRVLWVPPGFPCWRIKIKTEKSEKIWIVLLCSPVQCWPLPWSNYQSVGQWTTANFYTNICCTWAEGFGNTLKVTHSGSLSSYFPDRCCCM